jgi:hypothetical protein
MTLVQRLEVFIMRHALLAASDFEKRKKIPIPTLPKPLGWLFSPNGPKGLHEPPFSHSRKILRRVSLLLLGFL